MIIDFQNPDFSYFLGFIQADGCLSEDSRNRGRLTIELNEKDILLLEQFKSLLPCNSFLSTRKRDTNFTDDYKSATLKIYNKEFRDELISLGMIYGKKSDTAKVPTVNFSQNDYFRGFIDGNGSLGLTGNGYPFLSLVTASDFMKDSFLSFLDSITGKKKIVSRNKRDGIYNIVVYKEDAQKVVDSLYYDKCMCLERKKEKAIEVTSWKRPDSMRKIENKRNWTKEEDDYILIHSILESKEHLKRSESSIKTRIWRLRPK